ncbi:unnamed protein product [Brassica oleracea]|uniref:(rape) hypothetical protein n=1 Tax=Brassica napus TaxID=3708 RepID=A0A816IVE2_BRANA|nr:unnamed protein product [Brassica napus]
MPNLEEIQRFSNPISNQPIPLSLEKIKDQVNDIPVLSSCLTSLSRFIDTDSQQVFECSSLENTDTENEDSDLDDTMDFEPEVDPNDRERVAPNSEHTVDVIKAPKPPNQKCE